jgi:hypothetical protein
VQGHLWNRSLSVRIETECKHCGQTLRIEIDSELRTRVLSAGARPLVFSPLVDFARLKDPSIIDAF